MTHSIRFLVSDSVLLNCLTLENKELNNYSNQAKSDSTRHLLFSNMYFLILYIAKHIYICPIINHRHIKSIYVADAPEPWLTS